MTNRRPAGSYVVLIVPAVWLLVASYATFRLASPPPHLQALATLDYFLISTVLAALNAGAIYLTVRRRATARWPFSILCIFQVYVLIGEITRDPTFLMALVIPGFLLVAYSASAAYLQVLCRGGQLR